MNVLKKKQQIPKMGDTNLCFKYLRVFLRILHGFLEVIFSFLWRLVYGGPGVHMPPIKNLLLLDSASTLALKIRTKKISSLEVVNSFIDRIGEINPILNCVVDERFEEARLEAAECDRLIQSGEMTESQLAKEKPFLGVPFTTKDCISVKGMIHTAGLWARRTQVAEADADTVALVRQAGAIPIALTNVSELCMWWESNNPVHGRSHNPYNTNHIVGGSSGGEGCIQAAAGSAFGLGSDIGGSIRIPATFNGIFGHKPSKLIVSNKGQYPVPTNATQNEMLGIGPMCRRAEDLAPLLKIISGKNADKLKLNEPIDVKSVKYYYQDSDMGGLFISPVHVEIKEKLRNVIKHLEVAHKVHPQKLENKRFRKSVSMWLTGMTTKEGPRFSEQLANCQGSINVYMEFIKMIFNMSHHTLIGLITVLVEKLSPQPGSEKYENLVREKELLLVELKDLLGNNGVLLYPTHPTPAPYHMEPLVKPLNFSYTGIFNLLGFPGTHCPLGLTKDGLPIGIQVIANVNNDRLCLAVARDIEKAFGGWVPPTIDV